MSKQPSARELLRKSREQKKLQQQQKPKPAQKTAEPIRAPATLKRPHDAQLAPDYEAQASTSVTNLSIDEAQGSPSKRHKASAAESQETAAISAMFGVYGDDESADDEPSDDRLPAGFFDADVGSCVSDDDDNDDDDDDDDEEESSGEESKDEELRRRVLEFENEMAGLEAVAVAVDDAAQNGGDEKLSDKSQEEAEGWDERVRGLVALRQQIVAQLGAPEPTDPGAMAGGSSDRDESDDEEESDADLASLMDWRKSGIN